MALNSQTAVVLLISALAAPAGAQIVLGAVPDPNVISMDVNLVNLLCSVRDKHGAYVKDLSKDDFTVLDNGRPRAVTHFARELDSPLTVALLLDVSGSVTQILDVEKAAAQKFLSSVLRPTDSALLVGFAQYVLVWQDLTSSRQSLESALERAGPMRTMPAGPAVHGGTLLRDAVNLVARQKLMRLPGRKTMVIVTDGEDSGSLVPLDESVRVAQEADTVIYGIYYADTGSSHGTGLAVLNRLSAPTGGRAFRVDEKTTLDKVLAAIQEEMRNQYGLGYPMPEQSKAGSFHKVEVKMRTSGLKVQVRDGYYASEK